MRWTGLHAAPMLAIATLTENPVDRDQIRLLARALARPYRITRGEKFKLKDFDPGDTGPLDQEDKPVAQRALQAGKDALATCRKSSTRRTAGRCCSCSRQWMRQQGQRDQARDVRRQSAGLPGVLVQGAHAPRTRPRRLWRCWRAFPERGRIASSIAAITRKCWW